jgi:DivIVA domain-containing protein
MSATELDLPVLITAEQIRVREFVTARRGYDPDQVRDYLAALADQVDLMASMIRDARLEAEAAIRQGGAPRVDPYDELARRVAGVLREADEAAERSRMEGRRDAERLMAEARADADRLRTEAQTTAEAARRHAEQALEDARERADRTIAGLSTRRDALVDQLAMMQERLLGVARDIEATIVAPELVASPDADLELDEEPPPSTAATAPPAAPVVDLRGDARPPMPTAPMSIEELFADLGSHGEEANAVHDDLWGGSDAVELEVPDIPPLDLDWGDAGDVDDDPA